MNRHNLFLRKATHICLFVFACLTLLGSGLVLARYKHIHDIAQQCGNQQNCIMLYADAHPSKIPSWSALIFVTGIMGTIFSTLHLAISSTLQKRKTSTTNSTPAEVQQTLKKLRIVLGTLLAVFSFVGTIGFAMHYQYGKTINSAFTCATPATLDECRKERRETPLRYGTMILSTSSVIGGVVAVYLFAMLVACKKYDSPVLHSTPNRTTC